MKLNLFTFVTGILASPFLFAGVGTAQGVVKVGLVMTYTGVFGDAATQMDNGIKLYMKENGDAVAGKKVEVLRRDAGNGAVDVAKRLSQELVVRDNVDILAGFVTTPTALASAEISKEAKKFMVLMNAGTSLVPDKSPYMVRTSYTISQTSDPLARWAYQNGIRKAYTMVLDLAPGIDAETTFQRVFKELGGQIIGSVRFPVTNPDFGVYVQAAKDANPDALFVFVPGGSQPPALAKALAERGVSTDKVKVLGNDIMTDDAALRNMGDAGLGVITAAHYDHNLKNPKNAAFVAA